MVVLLIERQIQKKMQVPDCTLSVNENCVFHRSYTTTILGVRVVQGILQTGSIVKVTSKKNPERYLILGVVKSIQMNHHSIPTANQGDIVAVYIGPHYGQTEFPRFGKSCHRNADLMVYNRAIPSCN